MADSIKIFQVPASLDGVTPRKDGGVSLRFVTNEVSKAEKVSLMDFYQSFGWLQFSDQSIHEVPKSAPVREDGSKSPSKRLRDRLIVFYQHKVSTDMTGFESWYARELERIGNKYLERLEE